jgi:hypothetical protein
VLGFAIGTENTCGGQKADHEESKHRVHMITTALRDARCEMRLRAERWRTDTRGVSGFGMILYASAQYAGCQGTLIVQGTVFISRVYKSSYSCYFLLFCYCIPTYL